MVRKLIGMLIPGAHPQWFKYISLSLFKWFTRFELNNIPDTTSEAHTTDGVAQNCLSLAERKGPKGPSYSFLIGRALYDS